MTTTTAGKNGYGSTTTQPQPPSSFLPEHLSTYTAGEDAGRLAAAAKEFGLTRTRAPREQVRARVSDSLGALNMESLKLWAEQILSDDESYIDMRYRDIYRSIRHSEVDEEEVGLLLGELPGLGEEGEEGPTKKVVPKAMSIEEGEQQLLDPHAAGLGGTLSSATLGIIKGMVGPAILYLPHGFASAGYLVAVPVLMLCTAMFLWSSACLLESWRLESDRVNRKRSTTSGGIKPCKKRITLSYPELAYRAFGPTGERLVQVGISLMQSGVCLTYLIFVPQNLRASMLLLLNWDITTNWMLAFMMAVQIPLSWIRDIRRLTVTNLLANVLILYGLVTCLGFVVDDMVAGDSSSDSLLHEAFQRVQSLPAFNPSGWFLFLGTSVLLFEGSITLLVPLQEAIHLPADRQKFPDLYRKVILGIVSFYSFFGISCWMAFGEGVHTVMTTSLPPGVMATTVQLAYSLAVVFTFPLQNFPSSEIVCMKAEQFIFSENSNKKASSRRGSDNRLGSMQRNIISTLLVICLSIIAVLTMNDLDKVVSLMGSLLGCPLAFVLPPLIQNKLDRGQLGERKKQMNTMVAVLGVGAMVVSSICTLLKWE